jgi:hypothetical protein
MCHAARCALRVVVVDKLSGSPLHHNTLYMVTLYIVEVVDSAKYLGVTISEDLQWSKYIDNTVSKANRTMGFIRRKLRDYTVHSV